MLLYSKRFVERNDGKRFVVKMYLFSIFLQPSCFAAAMFHVHGQLYRTLQHVRWSDIIIQTL